METIQIFKQEAHKLNWTQRDIDTVMSKAAQGEEDNIALQVILGFRL